MQFNGFLRVAVASFVATTILSSVSSAVVPVITTGFTFAVASAGGVPATGTHFHSSTGGDFGNPAGKAEVGSYSTEEVRGLSEYNLTALAPGSAFVTFRVFKAGGLFTGTNDFPFPTPQNINIVAYAGNNTENITDYSAPSIAAVATFSTAGLVVGSERSFDITSIYNSLIASSATSLGIRLQIATGAVTGGGAYTFDTFRLTSAAVPEPTTFAVLAGASGLLVRRRRAD